MDKLKQLLLERAQLFFFEEGECSSSNSMAPDLVYAFESELMSLGYLCSQALRDSLQSMTVSQLTTLRKTSIELLRKAKGGHVRWTPLFRLFPKGVPQDTEALYIKRLLAYLYQQPDQPCVLCLRVTKIHALNPCGHLVCEQCWDGRNYSGCPICNRTLSADNSFLKPLPPRAGDPQNPDPVVFQRLDRGADAKATGLALFQQFIARSVPLSASDNEALLCLLACLPDECMAALPETIPVRESKALVLGTYLKQAGASPEFLAQLKSRLQTATDVLRVLCVASGGDAGLVTKPRFKSLPRAIRRCLLAALESCPFPYLCEDLGRHAAFWKGAGQSLHVFEYAKSYPKVALAFAILRKTQLKDPQSEFAKGLSATAAEHQDCVERRGAGFVFRSWAAKTEMALAGKDCEQALSLLKQRPGELSRRLDHLLRLAAEDDKLLARIHERFAAKVGAMASATLLTLSKHFQKRHEPVTKRVFFPKGEALLSYALKDTRATLKPTVTEPFVDSILEELLTRARALGSVNFGMVDEALDSVMVPFNERTASKSSVALPRGSRIPLPESKVLRLFVHWMQRDSRDVDLDLSAICYDDDWKKRGVCSFAGLSLENGAAIHSGDFTEAPPPEGASEFIDLDIEKFRKLGLRTIVMSILSYNNVPFQCLERGFAGFMARNDLQGEAFKADTVRHRFDLHGKARVCTPLLVDLKDNCMMWLDVQMETGGGLQTARRHSQGLGHLCSDFRQYFGSGTRASMYELGLLQACARSDNVYLRLRDQSLKLARRKDGESDLSLYRRVLRREGLIGADYMVPSEPGLAVFYQGDLDLPEGTQIYALNWRELSASRFQRQAATDLVPPRMS